MENKIKKIIPGIILLVAMLGIFIIFQPFSVNAATIMDGDLIKNPNAAGELKNDVYIVKIIEGKRFKRLLLSPHVFESYGHLSWGQIKHVSGSTMNQYPTSDLVRCRDLEKGINDPKVYKLTHDGTKEWLDITAQEFEAQGYDWDSIYIINKTDRDAYGDEIDVLGGVGELLPVDTSDPVFEALSQKIGQDDAEIVAAWLTRTGLVLTEEFIDNNIIDHSPGHDADNDITIIGDPGAPYFLEITKRSLNRLYGYSPEMYQYAISSLRYVRGLNFGTRCGAARTGGPWMEVNAYNYIYDYKDKPLYKQPLVSGFLFIHEATHVKNRELQRSGQIRKLTGEENEAIAYLAHAYYAREYDFEGQGTLNPRSGITLKEFVKSRVFRCVEAPEGYFWDWDFYVMVLEKTGFPSRELEKLKAHLGITSIASVFSNFQISDVKPGTVAETWDADKVAVKVTWDTDKWAHTSKFEYSLNSNLSSATAVTNDYFGGHSMDHICILANLSHGKTYYYRITNIDYSDNVSVSSIRQLTIPLDAEPAPFTPTPAGQPQFLLKWGYHGTDDGRFYNAFGIAIDASGNIYVVDNGNKRIQKFTSDGVFITKWGSEGSGSGQFNSPHSIAIDTSGNIYVVDNDNYRIQKFTSNGVFITKWGSQGIGDGQFKNPFGIAIDASGNVYVADQNNHRVQKFTSNGVFITKWGSEGSGDGQFKNPRGITTDTSGNVYMVDNDNYRIQKFTSNGIFITKWGSEGSGIGQFYESHDIAVDASGNIYVTEVYSRHRIQKFAPPDGF